MKKKIVKRYEGLEENIWFAIQKKDISEPESPFDDGDLDGRDARNEDSPLTAST